MRRRRVLAGVVSGAVGAVVYGVASSYIGPSELTLLIAGAATLGTYGAIDWLGLLPSPFQADVRSLLHRDTPPENRGPE